MLFTLDALISMVVAVGLITAAIFALKNINTNAWSNSNINELSMDYLTMLENENALEDAVISMSTEDLKFFLNSFVRRSMCAKIKLYDTSDNLLLVEVKTGCFSSDDIEVTKRSFVSDGEMYYAVMEGWFNE